MTDGQAPVRPECCLKNLAESPLRRVVPMAVEKAYVKRKCWLNTVGISKSNLAHDLCCQLLVLYGYRAGVCFSLLITQYIGIIKAR